jgi:hypothetical protein
MNSDPVLAEQIRQQRNQQAYQTLPVQNSLGIQP